MENPSTNAPDELISFHDLGLSNAILSAIEAEGYQNPTPIQAATIPLLLEGHDLIAQAKTGTGKTAAFALPLLDKIDPSQIAPQLLVIAPTRELALQVAESVKTYSQGLSKLHVLAVYGGQGMTTQLNRLSKGVHVVVGTPGRIIDHLNRGTLKLGQLKALVLDEADEMLRMGFIEDVERILESVPETRQTALFSATMPPPIARIAKRFLKQPKTIHIKGKEATVESIAQSYVTVSGILKLEALSRILEVQSYDGVIVFTKTRIGTTEVVERLNEKGIEAVALNGDMNQQARQHTIDRFKDGKVDILVCTDVAARGLDVPRVSHVINYDIPYDTEAYVHRIGRTGRAGREGQSITFVAKNDSRMFQNIERATRKKMTKLSLPSAAEIAQSRIEAFKTTVVSVLESQKLKKFARVADELAAESETELRDIAAALIYLSQQERPFHIKEQYLEDEDRTQPSQRTRSSKERDRAPSQKQRAIEYATAGDPRKRPMAVYRVAVGSDHGLEPRNLVGAISNETGIPAKAIGGIRIAKDSSLVELPANMPKDLLQAMKNIWVCGVKLNISHEADHTPPTERHERNRATRARNSSKQSPSRKKRNEARSSKFSGKTDGPTKRATRKKPTKT